MHQRAELVAPDEVPGTDDAELVVVIPLHQLVAGVGVGVATGTTFLVDDLVRTVSRHYDCRDLGLVANGANRLWGHGYTSSIEINSSMMS